MTGRCRRAILRGNIGIKEPKKTLEKKKQRKKVEQKTFKWISATQKSCLSKEEGEEGIMGLKLLLSALKRERGNVATRLHKISRRKNKDGGPSERMKLKKRGADSRNDISLGLKEGKFGEITSERISLAQGSRRSEWTALESVGKKWEIQRTRGTAKKMTGKKTSKEEHAESSRVFYHGS